MSIARTTLSLAGVVLAIATTLAIATLWLLLTEPVTVADAVARGDVSPLMSALAGVLAVAVLGAETLGADDQHALAGQAAVAPGQQAFAHGLGQRL